MNRLQHKIQSANRRRYRVRKLQSSSDRPRLTVHISNLHVSAQVVDDITGKTVAAATTVGSKQTGSMTDKAKWVGEQLAAKAKKAEVVNVKFDRGPKLFHGRVKALADAAREGGLKF